MIRVNKLEKSYSGTTVLDIPSLRIKPGSHVVLVGHNGAGKTTLLTMLAGLSRPTSGTLMINRVLVGEAEARRAVSFVPDQPALFDDLTVAEQMLYVAKLNGQSEPTDFSRDLIDRFEFDDLLGRFPQAMSKGQRQKSGLLVGTARPFRVLLLDEPTTGLDAASRQSLINALVEFTDGGGVVMSSTHDPELIEAANRQITIEAGEIIADTSSGSDDDEDATD